ncbi:AP-1 complex subunit mu-1 [Capsicum annuum]|uniref:AP-1 complex subunit mu-1 n=1 Tax=Capsicum annuum TaxID=4072 RepID=A0A2G2ZI41_CAPAN|nr:AP-1 complex subunit mu-1 [Capsicum annuum]
MAESSPIFNNGDRLDYRIYILNPKSLLRHHVTSPDLAQCLCMQVFKHYFEELEEESLRDNFVVVYELLDEMMDFGYPQYTEAKILSEFIKTDAYRMEVTQRPPMAVTNAVSWRSEGIQYKKNEVFLDVVESVNILVNSNGQIVRSDVVGALKMRTYLSGMPECKLGLNDRVLLEAQGRNAKGKAIDLDDIKFHQCVRLARFENDRTISFIPPDGAFEVMTYRLSTQVKPLVWVEAQVERHSKSRVEILVKARSQFKERSTAINVEIELPVPTDATNPDVRTSMGSSTYAPEKDALIWKIKSFPGGKEYMLRAEFRLPSITAEEAVPERKAPVRVKFEIPYFTVSGIQDRIRSKAEYMHYKFSSHEKSKVEVRLGGAKMQHEKSKVEVRLGGAKMQAIYIHVGSFFQENGMASENVKPDGSNRECYPGVM